MIIYKYKLENPGETTLMLPRGARILKVMLQRHMYHEREDLSVLTEIRTELYLWAEVDLNAKTEKRVFTVIPTGIDLPDEVKYENYIDSYQDESYVGHVYELIRSPRLVPDNNHDPVPPQTPQPMRAI